MIMDGSKVTEKTARYLKINDAIQRLSGSVGILERFIREARGEEDIGKDGAEIASPCFQDVYSLVEERLNEIKGRIVDATANLREMIEG